MPGPSYNDDEDIIRAIEAYNGGVPSVTQGMQLPQQPQVVLPGQAPEAPLDFMPKILNQLGPGNPAGMNNVPSNPYVPGVAPAVPPSSPWAASNAPNVPYGPTPDENGMRGPVGAPTPVQPQTPVMRSQGRPSDAVDAARAQVDQDQYGVAQAGVNSAQAGLDAQGAKIDRAAGVQEQYTEYAGKVNDTYRANREQARREADMETGQWLQKMETLAKEEPNHQRYWQNTDAFGKSLWLLGMAFSSAALIGEKSAGQRHNPVLEMLKNEIQQDVAAQKDRLTHERETMKVRGDIMQRHQGERITDLKDDYSLLYQRLEGLKQAALLRASAPGPEDTRAALMAGAQALGQMQLKTAEHRADEAFTAKESALNRQNQLTVTSMNNNAAMARTMAEVKSREKLAVEKAPSPLKDMTAVSTGTGIRVVDAKTGMPVGPHVDPATGEKTGALYVKEGKREEAVRELANQAQRKYAAMGRLASALEKDDDINLVLRKDVQLQKDMIELGYAQAKEFEPGGRVTDKDFSVALRGSIGADLESWTGRAGVAAGIGPNQSDLASSMRVAMKNYPKIISNQLTSELPAQIPGYEGNVRVDWSPKSLEADPAVKETADTKAARWGIDNAKSGPITSPSQLKAQEEAGNVQPYVPAAPGKTDHGTLVRTAVDDMKNSSPDMVREIATKALDAVKDDPRAYLEVSRAARQEFHRASEITRGLVTSGPKDPTEIQKRATVLGVEVPDDEAKIMSAASQRADLAIQWWKTHAQQEKELPEFYNKPREPLTATYKTDRLP